MIAKQVKDFALNGNITNSVNFPNCSLPRTNSPRIAISNNNVPNMVGQITGLLADQDINIDEMLNKSKGDLAYTIVDVSSEVSEDILNQLRAIDGVYSVRYFS